MKIPHAPPAPPATEPKPPVQGRFIPREELGHFEAWAPGALSETGPAAPGRPGNGQATRAAPGSMGTLHAARQTGYEEGYRDGLAALEGFKQSFANQTTAQVGALLQSVGVQLDALQQALASALVDTATQLARQVVRSELGARPELIAEVAKQALEALMLSARHITLRLHADDQPLVAQGAADVLAARGARLIADAAVQRGGCVIESDLGRIDASIESRWRRSVASIGSEQSWDARGDAAADAGVANPTAPHAASGVADSSGAADNPAAQADTA
ncbi:MAG: flagellar assembly protein FliH [Burkholderiales bacterium]|jgi:flagellar assembly protein FliH|nr:flagellar assembly protein FliH [Burkholderiales bacterium]